MVSCVDSCVEICSSSSGSSFVTVGAVSFLVIFIAPIFLIPFGAEDLMWGSFIEWELLVCTSASDFLDKGSVDFHERISRILASMSCFSLRSGGLLFRFFLYARSMHCCHFSSLNFVIYFVSFLLFFLYLDRSSVPVSYTHLDVYKRQLHKRPPFLLRREPKNSE